MDFLIGIAIGITIGVYMGVAVFALLSVSD